MKKYYYTHHLIKHHSLIPLDLFHRVEDCERIIETHPEFSQRCTMLFRRLIADLQKLAEEFN